jgi:Uma2 family endonuclease
MRNRRSYDVENDPPPDLALEIEIASSAFSKMEIYAKLAFPEIWRFDGSDLIVHLLTEDGTYEVSPISRSFSEVPVSELSGWVDRAWEMIIIDLIPDFHEWIRAGMPRGEPNGH